MKLKAIVTIFLMCPALLMGQRTIALPEVVTSAARPMSDIGLQRTKVDSLALKENVALSMADVLAYNSSLYVKNYGRATLSTVAFRGTSPSHTTVTWNGMDINSPMSGMTDFSMIPSFFIDNASLLHGTSSVTDGAGGLGGSVRLSTEPGRRICSMSRALHPSPLSTSFYGPTTAAAAGTLRHAPSTHRRKTTINM